MYDDCDREGNKCDLATKQEIIHRTRNMLLGEIRRITATIEWRPWNECDALRAERDRLAEQLRSL